MQSNFNVIYACFKHNSQADFLLLLLMDHVDICYNFILFISLATLACFLMNPLILLGNSKFSDSAEIINNYF